MASAKAIARVETLVWVLLFGGLLTLVLGLALLDHQLAVGWVLVVLGGLRAEGEAAVLVHWTLAEDIRALRRVKDALDAGKPLPLALKEARVWGLREKLLERVLPQIASHQAAHLLEAAVAVQHHQQVGAE